MERGNFFFFLNGDEDEDEERKFAIRKMKSLKEAMEPGEIVREAKKGRRKKEEGELE